MNNVKNVCVALVLAGVLTAGAAHADLLDDPAAFGPSTTIGFDGLVVEPGAPFGPVNVGGGTGYNVFASTSGANLSLGEAPVGIWGLGSNGFWSDGKTFAGVDGDYSPAGAVVSLMFDFADLKVQKIGGVFNYDPDYLVPEFGVPELLYIAALDENGLVLDYHFLNPYTPDGLNQGEFWGIGLDAPVISKFVVSGPFAVVDDLQFTQPVPEPSTYATLLAGLAALGWFAMRRRRP